MKKLILFVVISILAVACTCKNNTDPAVVLQIDSSASVYALENGVAPAVSKYADTLVTFFPADYKMLTGKKEVLDYYENYKNILEWKPERGLVSGDGNTAFIYGTASETIKNDQGGFTHNFGYYNSVWKNSGKDEWKLLSMIFNHGDLPDSLIELKREKFDPASDAAADIDSAVTLAKQSGKKILLDVGGEWCIWCHKMDIFIKRNHELDKLIHNKFVVVKLNYSPENKNEAVLSRFPKVAGYPHIFVLDENGELLHSQNTAELEKNKSYDLDKFMEFVNRF